MHPRVEREHGSGHGDGERTSSLTPEVERTGQSELGGTLWVPEELTPRLRRLPGRQQTPVHSALGETELNGDLGVGEDRPRRISVIRELSIRG